jgi:hypothetical protein
MALSYRTAIRVSGLAGVAGAMCWTLGDALIVGGHATPADYPLLMKDYADRIAFGALAETLSSSESRLAFGALIANAAIPLYLLGSWHFYRGIRPGGKTFAAIVFALLLCGNAWSPLGHAAFYFIAMVYKTVMLVPEAAHGALLDLGAQFHRVLMIAWLLPVVTLMLAMLLLALVIARGGTHYPRWAAAVLNPVSLMAIGVGLPYAMPEPFKTWLHGAGINIAWLFAYALSTALLWRCEDSRTL